jgi:hypothetical protein
LEIEYVAAVEVDDEELMVADLSFDEFVLEVDGVFEIDFLVHSVEFFPFVVGL